MSEFLLEPRSEPAFPRLETNPRNSPNRAQDSRSPVRIKRTGATSRGDFPLTPDYRKTLQTGWRIAQSGSNPSLRSGSLIIREITGNSSIFGDFAALEPEKYPHSGRALS